MPDIEPSALRDAIKDIKKVVRAIPDAYAVVIGGLAVQEWGFVRYTEDVDVVVDVASFTEIIDRLRQLNYEITPKMNLKHRETHVEIDLLKEGTRLKDATFPLPHPSSLGQNLGFATLPALIGLKIDAGRMLDQADIVQLLKSHLDKADSIRAALPESLRAKFDDLLNTARRELGV